MQNHWAKIAVLLCLVASLGCAYRFTNRSIVVPQGIRTVAVEGVFDTSELPLPHEQLWLALQQAIVREGHMQIADRQSADALIRIHVVSAELTPSGRLQFDGKRKDPSFDDPATIKFDLPDDNGYKFRQLTVASSFFAESTLQFAARIDVTHLRSRKKLFNKIYQSSVNLKNERASEERENEFLIQQEAINNRVKEMARDVSQNFLADFLISY